jgi:hypothetical protein
LQTFDGLALPFPVLIFSFPEKVDWLYGGVPVVLKESVSFAFAVTVEPAKLSVANPNARQATIATTIPKRPLI